MKETAFQSFPSARGKSVHRMSSRCVRKPRPTRDTEHSVHAKFSRDVNRFPDSGFLQLMHRKQSRCHGFSW
ncbi:hypothetical protein CRUP_015009 [Coryphaenoides rupestris]|nr:hypothetical protein CRUP_015009 [Coryphaenoides rupestris]